MQEKQSPQTTQLRPLQPEDADWIAQYANDFDVAKMVGRIPHPYDREMAVDFISYINAPETLTKEQVFVILEPLKSQPVGIIGIMDISNDQAEVGYWLGKPFWGKGLATMALRGITEYAFKTLNLKQLVAGHFIDNLASARVLEKGGFRYSGAENWQQSLGRGCNVKRQEMFLTRTDWQRL